MLNVTHGFGLRYNIAERVQTFTHPLWLGVLTAFYFVTSNVYFAAFAASVLLSAAAFWLALTRAASAWQAALAGVVLLFSRAFVDFSTSGLENPLSYVLIALFVGVYGRREAADPSSREGRWLTILWMLASLLYLTRPDDVLLVAPLLLLACRRVRRPAVVLRAAAAGLVPALAWTAFALIYYGFPFPNTAYAKLAMGIDRGELRAQGLLYLVDSLDRDPLTLTTIAFGVLLALTQRRAVALATAAGLVLHLAYVVSIGGDFMAGRFMAVPLFAAVLLLSRMVAGPRPLWIGAGVALLAVGSAGSHIPLWSNSAFGDSGNKPSGIIDERGVYFRERSLVLAKRATFLEPDWPNAGKVMLPVPVMDTCGLMGAAGLDFGPYTHLLDECALADPLLARLPAIYNPEWRVGHYRRMIPAGYRETLQGPSNVLQDPGLREYYDHLVVLTRAAPLFSSARLRAIWAMNTGRYNRLVNRAYYRFGGSIATLGQLSTVRPDETPSADPGNHVLTQPLAVSVEDRRGRRYVDVSLDSDDRYVLSFLKNGHVMSTLELGPIPQFRRRPGLTTYTADVPPRARAQGFDTIVVSPAGGDTHYALGHLLVEGYSPETDAILHQRVAIRDGLARQ